MELRVSCEPKREWPACPGLSSGGSGSKFHSNCLKGQIKISSMILFSIPGDGVNVGNLKKDGKICNYDLE